MKYLYTILDIKLWINLKNTYLGTVPIYYLNENILINQYYYNMPTLIIINSIYFYHKIIIIQNVQSPGTA